jgi:hypothetical protein
MIKPHLRMGLCFTEELKMIDILQEVMEIEEAFFDDK